MPRKLNTKTNSTKQEKKVAEEIGGKTTIASGALWSQKADVRNEQFLVECKTTSKSYYSLTENTWRKIKKEALKDNMRIPLMCIDLEDGKYRIAVMNYLDFMGLGLDTKAQYLGNLQPHLIEAASYRVKADFLEKPFPQAIIEGHYPCRREDIKFLGINNHLVLLPWDCFVTILDKEEPSK